MTRLVKDLVTGKIGSGLNGARSVMGGLRQDAMEDITWEAENYLPGVDPETGLPNGSVRTYGYWSGTNTASGKSFKALWYHYLTFDENGSLASLGIPKLEIIDKWLRDPFFSLEPPRSTGREQFGFQYLQKRKKELGDISKEDLIST